MSAQQCFAATGPWRVDDPIVGEPKRIRTLRPIDPRRDIEHGIGMGFTLAVERVDPDRRGVTVRNCYGHAVSLHPSEFEVLEFA